MTIPDQCSGHTPLISESRRRFDRAAAPAATAYEQHHSYVLGVLARRCGWLDPSDREALLHDAYAVFLEKQRAGRLEVSEMRPAQVRAYLTQTALNKAMDEGKRAGRRRSVSLDDDEARLDVADPAQGPDEAVAARLEDARVREIVAELPERQQLIVRLRFFLNRTPEETQRHLGLTERVYRRELERATRHLAERFQLLRAGRFCESRRSLILAYVAGIAGPNRRAEARRHLESCPACRHWAAELHIAVRRAAQLVPPPSLAVVAAHSVGHRLLAGHHGARGAAARFSSWRPARLISRIDPSHLSALSSARPSAVALLAVGCVAAGSTATYCALDGLPSPIRSLLAGTPPRHRPVDRGRTPLHVPPAPPPLQTTRSPAAHRPASATTRSRRSRSSSAQTATASLSAQQTHLATSSEFGVGGGSPASTTTTTAPRAAPTPSKPLREFDP